jgi:hypothetical protein
VTDPQQQVSPDGQWRWDGHQWVPNQPAGYGPPVPGYGTPAPAYGYPAAPTSGYGAPPAATGTDGKAIASLVLAVVGLCGAGSIAAVVLGHLSRRDARREGREPSGLALAGLIIGYIGIAATVVIAGVFITGFAVSSGHVSEITTCTTPDGFPCG